MSGRAINAMDTPWIISAVCVALVLTHSLATTLGWVPDIWAEFLTVSPALQSSLYLGLMGGAAILSGFAGVIVVFGLSATSDRFREFRVKGGKRLARNWASTCSSGLGAAALSLLAAILAFSPLFFAAPWLFELAILFVVHSGIRLTWLLRGLVKVVRFDDIEFLQAKNEKASDRVRWKK